MGFDLWRMLGVAPSTGLAMMAAGVLGAAFVAVRTFRRQRVPTRVALGLTDGPRVP